jgi:hypothetical protein
MPGAIPARFRAPGFHRGLTNEELRRMRTLLEERLGEKVARDDRRARDGPARMERSDAHRKEGRC